MNEQELFGLMAVAEENTKSATLAVDKIANERAALANTITNLDTQIAALKTVVENAASKGVRDSLKKAPEAATTALDQATKALNNAAGTVKSSANWITWKLAVIVVIVCMAMVGTAYGLGRYMVPSNAEIEAKRAELAQLKINIADLAKRGSKIKLGMCDGRICALASTNQGKGNENWSSPWTSNGTPLVILDGY